MVNKCNLFIEFSIQTKRPALLDAGCFLILVLNQTFLNDYVEIIKIVTRKYSIPFLDMMQEGGLAPRVPIHQELYMPDGLHPNDAGQGRISARLKGFLQSL